MFFSESLNIVKNETISPQISVRHRLPGENVHYPIFVLGRTWQEFVIIRFGICLVWAKKYFLFCRCRRLDASPEQQVSKKIDIVYVFLNILYSTKSIIIQIHQTSLLMAKKDIVISTDLTVLVA